jgi:hypothetical protein
MEGGGQFLTAYCFSCLKISESAWLALKVGDRKIFFDPYIDPIS